MRAEAPGLPSYAADEVVDYYKQLGDLNVSPDDGCYPLGSCTMKYNPMVNDWAAGLPRLYRCASSGADRGCAGRLSLFAA